MYLETVKTFDTTIRNKTELAVSMENSGNLPWKIDEYLP